MGSFDVLHNGEIYNSMDSIFTEKQNIYMEKLYEFNHSQPTEVKKRNNLLKLMVAEIGENCHIEPPFHANWGGKHVHFGNNVYANFNLTLVDDTHIYIGDHVMIGPNVVISTAGHPIAPELRIQGGQYNKSIHIENNVWIGSGVQIVPGVRIGENSVIGAGSIVTKDIPSNVVAFGNPCRIHRIINKDKKRTEK